MTLCLGQSILELRLIGPVAVGASDTGTVQIEVLPTSTITDAEAGPAGFSLSIGALPPGVGYTVEFKNQLDDPAWQPVPPNEQWPSTAPSFADEPLLPKRHSRLRLQFLSL